MSYDESSKVTNKEFEKNPNKKQCVYEILARYPYQRSLESILDQYGRIHSTSLKMC